MQPPKKSQLQRKIKSAYFPVNTKAIYKEGRSRVEEGEQKLTGEPADTAVPVNASGIKWKHLKRKKISGCA